MDQSRLKSAAEASRVARLMPARASAMPTAENCRRRRTPAHVLLRISASTQIISKGYVPLVNIPPLPPPPKNLKLNVGDKVVHPSHGLGEISAIEHREIGGAKGEFFIIRILDNGMRVMVPRTSALAARSSPGDERERRRQGPRDDEAPARSPSISSPGAAASAPTPR